MGRGIDYGGEEYNQGLPESDMKQKNVRRLTASYALLSTALVEKSTAARERYIQPRLGSLGSGLAVKQICMRSLGGLFARYKLRNRQAMSNVKSRGGKEAAEARRCAVMRVGTTGLSTHGA
jgi:hypothetical protein